MPAFGDRLTAVEIDALVSFVRAWEPTTPWVQNPRGTDQGGGPPWLRAIPDPNNPITPGNQGQGRGRGRQGGGPPWRQTGNAPGNDQQALPQTQGPATFFSGEVVTALDRLDFGNMYAMMKSFN